MLLILLSAVLCLRLGIWPFLRGVDFVFIDGLSNVLVSTVIVFISLPWFIIKCIKRQPFVYSGLELPLVLLCTAAFGSLFYTADVPITLNGVAVLLSCVVFFYMFIDCVQTSKHWRWMLLLLIGLAFCSSVYGIQTYLDIGKNTFYVLKQHRAISFFGWPNTLAGYLLLFIPLAMVLPLYFKKRWERLAAAMVFSVMLLCFLYTFSFLGWLSLMISGCLVMPFFWQQFKIRDWSKEGKRILYYILIGLGVLFIIVITRKDFLGSLSPRLVYYKQAIAYLIQYPLWGNGWDTFEIICRSMTTNRYILSTYVHNSYVQVWVEAGLIGFIGVVLLVVYLLRRIKAVFVIKPAAELDILSLGAAWGVLAFLIDNLFSFTLFKPVVSIFGWAMIAVLCAPQALKRQGSRLFQGGIFFLLLVLAAVLIRLLGGYVLYYQAMNTNTRISKPRAVEMLDQARQWDPWSSYIPAAQGQLSLHNYADTRKEDFLREAEKKYSQAIKRSPQVYYNYFVLSKINEGLGSKDKEAAYTAKARALSPSEFIRDNQMYAETAE